MMTLWTYRINAVTSPRTLMRVALIFDQQFMSMRRCLLEEAEGVTEICIEVCAEEARARRVHAKLYHLQDLRIVTLEECRDSAAAGARLPAAVSSSVPA